MATKRPLVHCRICKKEIDRDTSIEGVDWIQPSQNWYYHPKCYDDYAKKKKQIKDDLHACANDDLWFDALYDYLCKDLKLALDMQKTRSQWNNFLRKGFTAKGIYFCMRYFYDVQHGDRSKGDGIGIVTCIYNESCQYWSAREEQDRGILAKIEAQWRSQVAQQKVVVKQKKIPKKIGKQIDLAAIGAMEEDS